MNAADIRAWLASSQDYALGAALYDQLGTSAVYRRLFALPPTESSRRILGRELGALVAEPAAPAVAPPLPAAPTVEGVPSEAPALLADLQQQLKAVRDERSHLHPQLTAKGLRQQARLALCGRIVQLTDQEVALLAQLAHVQAHGRLPGPVPLAEVTEAGELRRRLDNLRSQRSKLKKDPAKHAELARVQADIELITTKLHPTPCPTTCTP